MEQISFLKLLFVFHHKLALKIVFQATDDVDVRDHIALHPRDASHRVLGHDLHRKDSVRIQQHPEDPLDEIGLHSQR